MTTLSEDIAVANAQTELAIREFIAHITERLIEARRALDDGDPETAANILDSMVAALLASRLSQAACQ